MADADTLATSSLQSLLLDKVRWRSVGPHRGGRVPAVAGDPANPLVFYFGSSGGGVWKTVNGGNSWRNVSDGFFGTASVGALAVAPSDPNVLYAGMGECNIRGNVAHGDGVYKSTDAGKTWSHVGLAETRHIARVRIHPHNPDTVYAAALGHVFGENPERGVYRSTDGGKTWEQILYQSSRAGAVDLAIDPTNPRILYAAFWECHRTPWSLSSGGPDSGLFKSIDGGDTWTDLRDRPGLPTGIKGRMGVAVSGAQPDRVWAIIEAGEPGLFRSDNGGETWIRVSDDLHLYHRPWYFCHIYADPQDAETVYILNVQFWKSNDGGRSFSAIATGHPDNHDLWIDPANPLRMVAGNDGGAQVSFDGARSWSWELNQPTGEFYHVVTDRETPYRMYGSQQDNSTISVPSKSDRGLITLFDWYDVAGGESGDLAVRPDDPHIVYGGSILGAIERYDQRTLLRRDITVWPDNPIGWGADHCKVRFAWTFPIVLSPHDPNVLYTAGNQVFRTTDQGTSWEAVSPDLTRNDPTKMKPSGGPITKDNASTEYYCTVFAFAESPVRKGVLWAGSDDGLIHVSKDGGETWENVTPAALPEWTLVSIIEPSHHDPAAAYVAATKYKLDDFRPYVFRTADYGQTWEPIAAGIPKGHFARVVREDPERQGLLYLGTEGGAYVSWDAGRSWRPLQSNLPVVPVHDLSVSHTGDLVAATHGRAFWVLDDLTPLRSWEPEHVDLPAVLFRPRPGYRKTMKQIFSAIRTGTMDGLARNLTEGGENPPDGVVVRYFLGQRPRHRIAVTILDVNGNAVLEFARELEEAAGGGTDAAADRDIPADPGLNEFVWDMRYAPATEVPDAFLWDGNLLGPPAVPGRYRVKLQVDDQVQEQDCEVRLTPGIPASQADLQAQFDLLQAIRDKLSETHDAVNTIRDVRGQVNGWLVRCAPRPDAAAAAARARELLGRLGEIEEELIQIHVKGAGEPLTYPIKLNNKLASLKTVVGSTDGAPTRQSYQVFEELGVKVDRQLERLQAVLDQDVKAFNEAVRDSPLGAVSLGQGEARR
ncbi:MAG: hypothetical protein WD535_05165 [Thermaerobacterales bacterium]